MDSIGRILPLFVFASSLFVLPCASQSVHAFNWGFDPNFVQTSLRECDTRPIHLIPLNASTTNLGFPPYYMSEYAVSGVTIVTPIGDDPSNLSWQVKHPKGSSLLLTVIDSVGQSGGFTSDFFSVTRKCNDGPAGNTACQPSAPANPAIITPNVTTTINTCQPWGLTITGGVKPYNISLAAVASPVVTNVTMGAQDDVFTFIDRADPGTQILAAVVDATGQWGISSIAVKTAGSKDTSCIGLVSSSKTKAQIQGEVAAATAASASGDNSKPKTTSIVLGIIFGLILPLILIATGFWWWRRCKRLLSQTAPHPFEPDTQERGLTRPSLNIDTCVDGHLQRPRSCLINVDRRQTDSPTSVDMTAIDIHSLSSNGLMPLLTSPQVQSAALSPGSPARSPESPETRVPPSAATTPMSMVRSPFAIPSPGGTPNSTSPAATLTPTQRYRKMQEALAEANAARSRLPSAPSGSAYRSIASVRTNSLSPSSTRLRPPVHRSQSGGNLGLRAFPMQQQSRRAGSSLRITSSPSVEAFSEVGPDIIIQHRDGGIVEELPPPYRPATPRRLPLPPLALGTGSRTT